MKIGVVGCGHVGSASAYACLLRGVGSELMLVDQNMALAQAQAEDIQHAAPFAATMRVRAGENRDLSGAGVVMIAAGAGQKPGETRLDLLARNAAIFAQMIPSILDAAPEAILLIATNPVDVMTHLAAGLAERHGGPAMAGRVIGSGTILDTARFRTLLAAHLGVSSHSVHAYVLGEHGDSEVLHWSGATAANLPLAEFAVQAGAPITADVRQRMDEEVRNAAYRIICGKGATWYGVGAGMARLAQAILEDEHAILTCCAPLDEAEGVQNVTLSVPRLVGAQGIVRTLQPLLNEDEKAALQRSAQILQTAILSLEKT